MKPKTLLIIGFVLISILTNAQTNFKPGYVINNESDTLLGEVDSRSDYLMSKVCRFKNEQGIIVEYLPFEIESFRFTDGKFYISKEIENEKFFVEYLIKGELDIYYLRNRNNSNYYVSKSNGNLDLLPYNKGVRVVDGRNFLNESKKHIGVLTYYMQDAPGLYAQIKSINKPEHSNLIKIAKKYHDEVCEDEECIIYSKTKPENRVAIEIVGEVMKFHNNINSEDGFVDDEGIFSGGVLTHIKLYNLNERLFIRTGVLWSSFQEQLNDNRTEVDHFFRFPCQIEYIYPKGIIRPHLAFGPTFTSLAGNMVSLNTGIKIETGKKISFNLNIGVDFENKLMFVPSNLITHYISSGLILYLN